MNRRILAVLTLLTAFASGYLVGNAPDRELRIEARALMYLTKELARSCESVVVENIRMAKQPQARKEALVGP